MAYNVVSTAKLLKFRSLHQNFKSFMWILKNIEPRIDPCEKPQVTLGLADRTTSFCTYCNILERYDLNKVGVFNHLSLIIFLN